MDNNHLYLFENCKLCRGANRATIIDLQLGRYFLVPLQMADILEMSTSQSLSEIANSYDENSKEILEQYCNFIVSNNLGIITTKVLKQYFPRLDTEWDSPHVITNAIYDFSETNAPYFEYFIDQLAQWTCSYLEIRCFEHLPYSLIMSILNVLTKSSLKTIKIYINNLDYEFVHIVKEKAFQLQGEVVIILYNCQYEVQYSEKEKNKYLATSSKKILNESCCGVVDPDIFLVNMTMYTESLKYNTCLNRKVSISRFGEIKNCPSMPQSYGLVNHTNLNNAINSDIFKYYWHLTKDQTQICKDCEFRYLCTDCRAYIQNPKDLSSKPLKCGYDPYSNKWEDWAKNKALADSITFYQIKI